MTGESVEREAELFDRALDLPPAERDALLDRECAGDPALRARVARLLARDAQRRTRLDRPLLPALAGAVAPPGRPERLGPYRILGELGRGGMGVVYLGEQESPRRQVAIKVLRPGLLDPEVARRFEREAQVLGSLDHPGIARIYEAAVADAPGGPQPFLAMELVRGEPLTVHAERRRLSTKERLELLARVCDAVEHAHRRGVVHRDLKPGNVLVDEDGNPKVLDFGVARAIDPDGKETTLRTRAGELVGTLPYMSPEQVAGDPLEVDARCDVYALGALAYELLAGRPPFDLDHTPIPEATRLVLEREPLPLSSVRRELRGDVSTIVAKAMEKEKGRRYGSARELAADLRRFLRDEPILARPASGLYHLRKFARRNKGLTAGVALAALALAAGSVLALREAGIARLARDDAEERSRQALRQTRRATISAAALAAEAGDFLASRRLLDSVEPSDRAWEWRHLESRIDMTLARIESREPLRAARFGPSGEILLVDALGSVETWEPDGGRRRSFLRLEVPLPGPAAISRDGAWLAGAFGAESRSVGLFDLATGRRVISLEAREAPARAVAISGDGARVAFGGAKVWLWEPSTGSEPRRVLDGIVVSLAFSGDGRRAAATYGESQWGWGHFLDFDASTGALPHVARQYSTILAPDVALNGDGSLLAVAYRDKRVWLHDARSDRAARTLLGHSAAVRAVAFDGRGEILASGGEDRTVRLWEVRTGRALATLSGLPGPPLQVEFSPDASRLLARTEKEVLVWDAGEGDRSEALPGHPSYVYAVAFDPGGGRILSGSYDGTIRVSDAASRDTLWERREPRHLLALAAAAKAPVFASAHGNTVRLWDADSGSLEGTFESAQVVQDLALSADGSLLAVRDAASVSLWNARSGKAGRSWPCSSPTPYGAVALSPSGSLVASNEGKGAFLVWETSTGREIYRRTGHEGFVEALAFGADGALLATGGVEGTVRLWQASTGAPRWVSGGHADRVYALAFSPDGARLASGSNDTTIRLWDVETGEDVGLLRGHLDYVFSLAFSPDGARLASGSGDSSVRVWDTVPRSVRWRESEEARRARQEARPPVAALLAEIRDPQRAAERLRKDPALDGSGREAAIQALFLENAEQPEPR